MDQANSSSDLSQISLLHFPIVRASLPHSPSLSDFALATWNPLQHNPHHLLHQLLYFVLPLWTTSYYRYWIYQTICKAKLMKVIFKLYTDHNSLWTKQTTHQKAGSLRVTSLSKLDNMINNDFIFNTKYAEFSTKW